MANDPTMGLNTGATLRARKALARSGKETS